jgi:hypothetical protein
MSVASTGARTLDAAVIGGGLHAQLTAQGLTELTGVMQAVASSIVAPVTPPAPRYSVHMTTTLHGYNIITFGINEQDAFVEAIAILGECETTDIQVTGVVDRSAQLHAVGTWELHSAPSHCQRESQTRFFIEVFLKRFMRFLFPYRRTW